MSRTKWSLFAIILFIALSFLILLPVAAQDGEDGEDATPTPEPTPAPTLLIDVAGIDAFPGVDLQVNARDGSGEMLDLTRQFIAVTHDGTIVDDVRLIGDVDVGTYTVLLLDLPPGVADSLPALQDAILNFASEPTMKDQVDYVVVYRVGEGEPVQLLAPTNFINGVENEFRTQPPDTDAGPTALIDTLSALLDDVSGSQPLPELRPSIVLFTDGTDAVSEAEPDAVIARAVELGIPIHTIAVDNVDLGEFATTAGREFLAELSAQTGGIGRILDEPEMVSDIWNRIAATRSNTIVRYIVPEPAAGTFDVTLSLPDMPEVPAATTTVTIPGDIPTIVFTNEPPTDENGDSAETYTVSMPTPGDELRLHFTTESGWLDGTARTIAAAQLVVNGEPGPEIDPARLDNFSAEISGLTTGLNTIALIIEDADGKQARTDDLLLMVSEGEASVPQSLRTPLTTAGLIGLILLGVVVVIVIVWLVRTILRRMRERANRPKYVDPNPRPKQRAEPTRIVDQESEATTPPVSEPTTQPEQAPPPPAPPVSGTARFELLRTATELPQRVAVSRPEFLIGSAPTADLALVDDPDVARIQATVIQDGVVYRIFGEIDAPQLFINDLPVPDYGAQLTDGDVIAVGDVQLRFLRG